MMAVLVTPSARRDLLQIWDYIAADSADAADRVIANIHDDFRKIADAPGIGHTRQELDPVYRVWSIYSYLIVYRPDTRPLQIIRVVSGYRDLSKVPL
jgi:plasmid stabilization system protein ParE